MRLFSLSQVNSFRRILFFIFSVLFLVSCTKETELDLVGLVTSGTVVSQDDKGAELSMGPEAGSASITISANKPWTAEVQNTRADAWISLSATSGKGGEKLSVSVGENTTFSERSATVAISCDGLSKTIRITQKQNDALVAAKAIYKIGSEGGMIEVELGHNIDFEVRIDKDWVTRPETRSYQVEKLSFNVAPNESVDAREASITFISRDGSKVQKIQVVQAGKSSSEEIPGEETPGGETPGEETATFEVKSNAPETTVGYKGCEFSIDVYAKGVNYEVAVTPEASIGVAYLVNPETREGDYTYPGILLHDTKYESGYDRLYFVVGGSLGKATDLTVTITPDNASFEPVVVIIHQEEHPDYHAVSELYRQCFNKDCGWNEDKPVNQLPGMEREPLDKDLRLTSFYLSNDGKLLSGSLPDCIGDLDHLEEFALVGDNSGVVGTLPSSMSKLTRMKHFMITQSGLTGLPDIFGGWNSLESVAFIDNSKMGGTLPVSLCAGKKVKRLSIWNNEFTGTFPEEWCKPEGFDGEFDLSFNRLSGTLSQKFFDMRGSAEYFENILKQKDGCYFDVSDVDVIKGSFLSKLTDIDGSSYDMGEVVSASKYTVKLYWATWCPFSKGLMPLLKTFYDKYHKDGLEIIAMNPLDYKEGMSNAQIDDIARAEVASKGYGWHFVSMDKSDIGNYPMLVPAAIVYDNKGNIVFSHSKCRDRQNRFDRPAATDLIAFLESKFGPLDDDDYESTDYYWDKAVTPLQTASVGNGINLVIMGDGYTDKDMGDHGLYETLMTQAMEEFFDIEPYRSLRDRFNVFSVKAVSKQGKVKDGSQTALSTYFGEGSFVGGDEEKCYEYASCAYESRENLLIIVLVNGGTTHGTAYMNREDGSAIAFVATNLNERSLFGPTLRHEAGGHGFAKLADEYSNSFSGQVPASVVEGYKTDYESLGMWANVDFTSDPANIKWNKFISDGRYAGEVGIYEGGATYEKGVWRPTQDSMMNQNAEWFNAPSRHAIYKRVMEISGEGYSWEKFLEYDAINRGAAATKAARTAVRPSAKQKVMRGHAPVVR